MVKEENRNTYQIHADSNVGEVQIADEVVATIAALAATEVEGVAAMSGNATRELVSKLGMKGYSKGVKIEVSTDSVSVDLSLTLNYGYSIPETSRQVQEKVKAAIENMTGLTVSGVNVRISDVNIDKNK
ncbi:Asp23/Gls24 family envelope stress response protein [Anaerocolumna chitinilytica]|uniref:Alkaline-shock protein n=1 Tax=Anaerocolumna chitinilytica TaxID=1727145 RepID=A0A7I8DQF7_9FIRM|nr:Asp23/Gls24 family envelope stress response protein [Anaerocolumna chitinilytica]BCK00523.1 alkaline-shock protein [Anaerocolumna chitinilytica]